jgi:hypothetical protein
VVGRFGPTIALTAAPVVLKVLDLTVYEPKKGTRGFVCVCEDETRAVRNGIVRIAEICLLIVISYF